jgi:ABC-type Na+ efflux pump permease subunit
MSRILLVARREVLETLRQPWLLVNLTSVLGVVSTACLALLTLTDWVLADPARGADLTYWTDVAGFRVEAPGATLAASTVLLLQALVFNQLMSMTAVMAGHAGLHDRQCGTLPFLLLAPIRRGELLAGKVLGSLAVPFAIYVVVGGSASVLAAAHPSAAPSAALLPPSPGWAVGFLGVAPLWALATGTVCTLVSAVAQDVRTAQQAAWAVVFLATFALSPLLVALVAGGPAALLPLAVLGAAATAGLLAWGAWRLGRSLGG